MRHLEHPLILGALICLVARLRIRLFCAREKEQQAGIDSQRERIQIMIVCGPCNRLHRTPTRQHDPPPPLFPQTPPSQSIMPCL